MQQSDAHRDNMQSKGFVSSLQDATAWAGSQQASKESMRLEALEYVQKEQRRLEEAAQAHQRQCDAAVQLAKGQAER